MSFSFFDIFQFQFAQIALAATILIAAISGLLSPIVVLKQRSYLGDTLSHLVFPGVISGILIAETTHFPMWACVFLGSLVTATFGTFLSEWILKNLKIPPDSSAVICLSAFFALGIIVISGNKNIRISPESILFGDVLTLNFVDISILASVFVIVCLSILGFRKHWNAWLADPEFAEIAGFKVKALDRLFPVLLALSILSGLFAVGGLMISALITIPAILYQPKSVFSPWVISVSLACGLLGILSAFCFNWPVGPTIVLAGFGAICVKLLFMKISYVR